MTDGQRSINSFSADTHTETVVQTVVLDLETSEAKNKKVTIGIEEFQRIAGFFGDIMPSIPEYERTRNNPAFYNLVKREFADSAIKSSVARDAAYHAIAMYDSHSSNGSAGDRPDLGNGSFMQLCSQDFEIADNGSGYGLKASFIPYDAVWFGISLNPHTEKYLRRVFEDEAETGSCELHLSDDGDLRAHVAIKWEVEVYEAEDVSTVIGVDIGENVLYSVAAVDGDSDVESVEMESGAEFRHYREQFKQKRTSLMEKGDLRASQPVSGMNIVDTPNRHSIRPLGVSLSLPSSTNLRCWFLRISLTTARRPTIRFTIGRLLTCRRKSATRQLPKGFPSRPSTPRTRASPVGSVVRQHRNFEMELSFLVDDVDMKSTPM